MAAFARTELDLVGIARQDNQAAVQLFVDPRRQAGRARRVPARRRPRGARRRGPDRASSSSTTPGDRHPAARSSSRRCPARTTSPTARGVPDRAARRTGPPARPAARREARADGARGAQRRRDARPRAGPLAGRPGQDPRRAGGAGRRASACPACRPRIECYDISNFQGARRWRAWSCSRTASRGAASTGASGSRPSRGRTTSPATRRSCAAASAAPGRRGGQRGGAALGDCRTWSSSTAARARSAPRRRCSTSSGCTTCRWPVWPRSARSCSCPGRAEPVLLPTTSQALYLVQRLRDEAHRFAITYHRDLRAKASVRSAFDDLPGVGPTPPAALLRVFGSIKRVREAPVEQIAAVPGHRPGPGGEDQGHPRGLTGRPVARMG